MHRHALMLRLAEEDFAWREWAGEAVIYDAISGDTHRLPAPAGSLLTALRQHGAAALAGAMLPPGETSIGLDEVIDALLALGIVERIALEDRHPV
ncbi:MAG: HPr-rel-A system PqqD family peptide chaperone [Rhodocyclaceae bacterium]